MTPAEDEGMADAGKKWGEPGIRPNSSFRRGFAAGMAHAREQAAAQIVDRANCLSWGSCAGVAAAELREQAAKIRSGS